MFPGPGSAPIYFFEWALVAWASRCFALGKTAPHVLHLQGIGLEKGEARIYPFVLNAEDARHSEGW